MREKTDNPKGYLKLNNVEYTFSLESKYLFLLHKDTGIDGLGLGNLENWEKNKERISS